jgi:hypothetical protein
LLLPEASPKSSLSSWSDPPFADLPSSKNFINAGRHTHSNAQLKGKAMQFHAAHYGSPPHWVTWHKTQDSIRFYTTSFHTTWFFSIVTKGWLEVICSTQLASSRERGTAENV